MKSERHLGVGFFTLAAFCALGFTGVSSAACVELRKDIKESRRVDLRLDSPSGFSSAEPKVEYAVDIELVDGTKYSSLIRKPLTEPIRLRPSLEQWSVGCEFDLYTIVSVERIGEGVGGSGEFQVLLNNNRSFSIATREAMLLGQRRYVQSFNADKFEWLTQGPTPVAIVTADLSRTLKSLKVTLIEISDAYKAEFPSAVKEWRALMEAEHQRRESVRRVREQKEQEEFSLMQSKVRLVGATVCSLVQLTSQSSRTNQVVIRGFTEGISGSRIQVRISAIHPSGNPGVDLGVILVDDTRYATGSIIWDESARWLIDCE